MKFTKEEISLCKQVAKKHMKKINAGDWLCDGDVKRIVPYNDKYFIARKHLYWITPEKHKFKVINWFPLWTISDCLEFLSNQMYTFESARQLGSIFDVSFISVEGTRKKDSGDTLREACIKVVLAVLGEAK